MKWLGKTVLMMLAWVVVIVIVLSVLSSAMRVRLTEAPFNITTKINGFYALESDTLDVVFLGTSATLYGINPSVLWREYGIPSYVFASNEQPIFFNYLYAQEAVRTQHPDVIVLDTRGIRYTYDYARPAISHIAMDDIPMGLNKLKAIFRYTPPEEWLEHLFPIIKYHSALSVLKANFASPQEDPYLGYSVHWTSELEEDYQFANRGAGRRALAEREEATFREMIRFCRQEGVQLFLLNYPAALSVEDDERVLEIFQIADEEGVPYLDMNTPEWTAEYNYIATRDSQSLIHSNYLGAAKITRALGDVLSEYYGLPDHRGEADYTSWEGKTESYYQHELRQQNSLTEQFHIKDYLAQVADYNREGYAIVMSVFDEASFNADQEIDALLKALGWQHPISEDFRACHLFVSVDGHVVISEMDTEYAIYKTYEDPERRLSIAAWSAGYQPLRPEIEDDRSIDITERVIRIQDTTIDLARGLNIVVYDLEQQAVVDTALFDLYNAQYRTLAYDEAHEYPSPYVIADISNDYDALAACTNAADYFRTLSSMPHVVAIAVDDDASLAMTDEIVQSMQALGLHMSLAEQLQSSYIAVCQNGLVYCESLGGSSRHASVKVDDQTLLYLESACFGASDAQTRIAVNGTVYPSTGRGLYIIVYDNVNHLIVDRVALDTCDGIGIYR